MSNLGEYMYLRDMARRREDMRRGEMRDGRNPYGSRGGYIVSRDPRRRDRAMSERDYNRDYNYDNARSGREYEDRRGEDYAYGERRGGRSDYGYEFEYPRKYAGAYGDTPFYVEEMRDYNRGYYSDFAGGDVMSMKELEHLHHKLLEEVEQGDKDTFSKEKILRKAEELGIKFDKFSPESLAVATLMVYTDYCKTLGKGNLDMYIRLAKDFLCDEDSTLKGDEKLTAYFDYVVMPR